MSFVVDVMVFLVRFRQASFGDVQHVCPFSRRSLETWPIDLVYALRHISVPGGTWRGAVALPCFLERSRNVFKNFMARGGNGVRINGLLSYGSRDICTDALTTTHQLLLPSVSSYTSPTPLPAHYRSTPSLVPQYPSLPAPSQCLWM